MSHNFAALHLSPLVPQQALATLMAGGVKREDIFLTTKTLPCTAKTEADCKAQSLRDVALDLKLLGLDYVDLILLHGGMAMFRCSLRSCPVADAVGVQDRRTGAPAPVTRTSAR
jgi:aryl-alcohol dehydrogenase-like predicted oxidoreductase